MPCFSGLNCGFTRPTIIYGLLIFLVVLVLKRSDAIALCLEYKVLLTRSFIP